VDGWIWEGRKAPCGDGGISLLMRVVVVVAVVVAG
jgi:hypothetical protein